MVVYTNFADNNDSTTQADTFSLIVESNGKPKMPKEEYQRRVEGKFPDEEKSSD